MDFHKLPINPYCMPLLFLFPSKFSLLKTRVFIYILLSSLSCCFSSFNPTPPFPIQDTQQYISSVLLNANILNIHFSDIHNLCHFSSLHLTPLNLAKTLRYYMTLLIWSISTGQRRINKVLMRFFLGWFYKGKVTLPLGSYNCSWKCP